jgi:hypothetical protein
MVASLQVKIIPTLRRKGKNEALIFLLTFFIKEKSEAGLGGKPKIQKRFFEARLFRFILNYDPPL